MGIIGGIGIPELIICAILLAALVVGIVFLCRFIISLVTKGSDKDMMANLAQLKKLLDDGAITQDEYEQQKKRLLENR